jgi:hypothetical protein
MSKSLLLSYFLLQFTHLKPETWLLALLLVLLLVLLLLVLLKPPLLLLLGGFPFTFRLLLLFEADELCLLFKALAELDRVEFAVALMTPLPRLPFPTITSMFLSAGGIGGVDRRALALPPDV